MRKFEWQLLIKSFSMAMGSRRWDHTGGKYFFIIPFCAIMHRTIIVRNKIINSICCCLFFARLIYIYKPRLGNVWLARPNQKPIQQLNFYLRRRKTKKSTQNCMHYNETAPAIFIFVDLKKSTFFIKKPVKMFNYIYIFFLIGSCFVVKSLLTSMQFISPRCGG